jgi:hypothetical protein
MFIAWHSADDQENLRMWDCRRTVACVCIQFRSAEHKRSHTTYVSRF